MIQQPFELSRRRIRSEDKIRTRRDKGFATQGFQYVATTGHTPILPGDRGAQWVAPSPLPEQGRFPLAGNADGRDFGRRTPLAASRRQARTICLISLGSCSTQAIIRGRFGTTRSRAPQTDACRNRTEWPASTPCPDLWQAETAVRRLCRLGPGRPTIKARRGYIFREALG